MLSAGLHPDIDEATYHGDPIPAGSLSSTFARLLTRHVSAKALHLHANRKPTKSMNLGKAAHTNALGTGPALITWAHDGRTKEGKAERLEMAPYIADESVVAVTEAEREQITGMAAALLADKTVRTILEASQAEVSGFWQEGPTWLRARYDLLNDDEGLDYKTTLDASLNGFSRAMAKYGYHQQAEFYLRGLKALGHPAADRPLRFICQETTAPYLIQIHTPDEMAMETARLLNDRAIDLYRICTTNNVWPGYPIEAEPASLPTYYYYEVEDMLPDAYAPEVELKL